MPLFKPEHTPSYRVVRARIRRCTHIWEVSKRNQIYHWWYNIRAKSGYINFDIISMGYCLAKSNGLKK
jgi:hypothetical protein